VRFAERGERSVLAAVAAGGAIGAVARYQAGLAWPTVPGGFPWTTLLVNVVGSLAIGALLTAVTARRRAAHPLLRPFLATGVLGGFTTFSAFALDTAALAREGRFGLAASYLVLTCLGAIAGALAGIGTTRRLLRVGNA
jgi:fluoride exporter